MTLRVRAFTAGIFATFLSSIGRGGLMFMLIIWLQGIWLPLHGYDFDRTPLWAGIYMLPLTIGFLVAGPISGLLSDRYGARPFATAGMLWSATAFMLLELLPVDFGYWTFAPLAPSNGSEQRPVPVAQPGRGDEQPASQTPGCRVGHVHDGYQLDTGAVHRDLFSRS